MPARLTVFLPGQAAIVRTLREGQEYLIGRDSGAAIEVDDERVSRRHAVVRWQDAWSITDLESKNGTLVDGHQVTAPAALGDSTWLSLGGLMARFETTTDEQESADRARQLERWRSSLELRRRLSSGIGLEGLLQALLDSVLQLSGTRRGFVLLDWGEGELEVSATRNLAPLELLEEGFGGSVGAVHRALRERRPVVLGDVSADRLLAGRESVLAGNIRALVCVPLSALGRALGVVYADSNEQGKAFTELDLEILEALAAHASLAIAVSGIDRELEGLAAELARALPPEAAAVVPRLEAELERTRRRWRGPTPSLPPAALANATGLPTWSGIVQAHLGGAEEPSG
jgi:pSer/pThr/pTyr-binding forkhead associated (FHA) protein